MSTGKKSYNNLRMNKLGNDSEHSSRFLSFFDIKYVDNKTAAIAAKKTQNKPDGFILRTQNNYETQLPDSKWELDFTKSNTNKSILTAGILDQLSEDVFIADRFYLLFALYDSNNSTILKDGKWDSVDYTFEGFGLFSQPKSISTSFSSGNKGDYCTITLSVTKSDYNAYQFTTGAEVLVWYADTDWNKGIITSINSVNEIVVELDNGSYGYNLANSAQTIVQLDKFRPYNSKSIDTDLFQEYQLITGLFYIDSSGNLTEFDYQRGMVGMKDTYKMYDTTPTTTQHYYPLYEWIPPTAINFYGMTTINSTSSLLQLTNYINIVTFQHRGTITDVSYATTPSYPLVGGFILYYAATRTRIFRFGFFENLF